MQPLSQGPTTQDPFSSRHLRRKPPNLQALNKPANKAFETLNPIYLKASAPRLYTPEQGFDTPMKALFS